MKHLIFIMPIFFGISYISAMQESRIYMLSSFEGTTIPEFTVVAKKYGFSPQGDNYQKRTLELLGFFKGPDTFGKAVRDLLALACIEKVSVKKPDLDIIKVRFTQEAYPNFQHWGQE